MDQRFSLERLINEYGAGEGSNLPPRQFGDIRVPIVSNLKILRIENYFGGTTFTLSWDDPNFANVRVSQYNIFVSGIDNVREPQRIVSAVKSPATVRVTVREVSRLVFTIQTQLTNGATSDLRISPSVASEAISPVISPSSILPSGVTAGTYGSASTVGQFTVDTQGFVTSAANVQIYLDRLRLPVRTVASGPYTIIATDYLVLGDTTAGSFSILLPAAPTTGDTYCVKKTVAANTLTFDGNGANIDGAATIAITTQYTSYTVSYNGTEWSII
jgi:hypothetical protein